NLRYHLNVDGFSACSFLYAFVKKSRCRNTTVGFDASYPTPILFDVLGLVLFTILIMGSNTQHSNHFDCQLPDADIKYYRNFLSEPEATHYFSSLLDNLNWQQHNIKIFGKSLPQPRLTALYAETDEAYTYSGLTLHPLPYTEELRAIQKKIKEIIATDFTHCLANLYRDERDSMGLHADDEKELGKDPVIASVSLGETRKYRLKHKYNKDLKLDIDLEPGSLLIMQGPTQHFWKHELPRTSASKGPRINLT